ncbi:chromate transporter [Mycoplasmopsis fermentans]|nr:chromate transporter [Mycoplasmopsis fermentans]ADN69379.1 putative chromate transport protein [Mycoplasmopsis fermentans JER]ADV35003.1 Chromate transport protein [Mycoplasmopsis fermentans M64]VEU59994.1 Chromate transporter [Mycoplasmopsis fermentans]VEU66999.1 Chromate transporter [Mesomycoplasma conjunctivae]
MAWLALLVALPFLVLISLSVFGGGQIFMPIFSWFWGLFREWFGSNITESDISQVFAVGNATPGILSTKFALVTGYFYANKEWWGFIVMFLTYLVFVIPPILMMKLAMKYSKKFENNKYLIKLINIMNPVVTGIIVALGFQLFIASVAPQVFFNKSFTNYVGINNDTQKALFYRGWRRIAVYCYVPVGVILSTTLYLKKVPVVALILSNIVLALIIFEPWLG